MDCIVCPVMAGVCPHVPPPPAHCVLFVTLSLQGMDLQAELEARDKELAELHADYDDLGKTFGDLQEELEQVRVCVCVSVNEEAERTGGALVFFCDSCRFVLVVLVQLCKYCVDTCVCVCVYVFPGVCPCGCRRGRTGGRADTGGGGAGAHTNTHRGA